MKLSETLSAQVFELRDEASVRKWLHAAEKEIGGLVWVPLGGIDNNVHSVEVASDPALALVERPTNGIDALLDLRARELKQTADTPRDAAVKWWGVPASGLTSMDEKSRRDLADRIRVVMEESEVDDRPTIVIQDYGTGQHPDHFHDTLLSLLRSTKRDKAHQMGVYNAGGAATYKFAKYAIIVSRLAPSLLNGLQDEVGVSAVRYDPLDPAKDKVGHYVCLQGKDGKIIRLDIPELPNLPHGTYVKLIEYELRKYARGAHEPKNSLWHLLHACLPEPALPIRIVETRAGRFPAMKGKVERRVVTGLLHLLKRPGIADYSDERTLNLGNENGSVQLRYFVLNDGVEPEAYVRAEQALTVTLNGQRQHTKDRLWLKRQLDLFFLFKRLLVVVDFTGLTNAARRQVFSSTRETGVDSPLMTEILDRAIQEMRDDEELANLDELARQKTLESATHTTTEKVKKQLASQIGAYMKGGLKGSKGGTKKPKKGKGKKRKKRNKNPVAPKVDDSQMLAVPDSLKILSDPLDIHPGGTAGLRLEINAKNGFLPQYADCLSIVFGAGVQGHVRIVSKGKLLGGRVRVSIQADDQCPEGSFEMKVALVIPQLGVVLTAQGSLVVAKPQEDEEDTSSGGEPIIGIFWVGREKWEEFDPHWNEQTAGLCNVLREDQADPKAITKVEWYLNSAFEPYEKVVEERELTELTLKTFQENYEYPVCYGIFRQTLAEEAKEREADAEGRSIEVPDDYVLGERARLARAVLMAMEPEMVLVEAATE